MYVVFILEVGFRMVVGTIHPLTEEYYARTPPGKLGNVPLLLISATMLYLSLRGPRVERVEAEADSRMGA